MSLLRVAGVTKEFESNGIQTTAIQNITLKVGRNEIVTLLGPSGCGKTTLLHAISGFVKPTKGKILLEGNEVLYPNPRVGIVFQDLTLFPWLNIEENIQFGASIQSKKVNTQQLIQQMGLEGFERHYPFMLSRGMQQRVAIARTLAVNPKILLMDEPFASLDAQTKEKMQELVLRLHETEKTPVLFVTHDIEEALLIGDKIIVMTPRPGKIKAILSNPLSKNRGKEIKYTQEFLQLRKKLKDFLENNGRRK